MEIRFVSSLTADDENNLAPALLRALTALLDQTAIAYTLRIQTSGNKVYQQSQPARNGPAKSGSVPASRLGLGVARD